jgi:hypothetical protein
MSAQAQVQNLMVAQPQVQKIPELMIAHSQQVQGERMLMTAQAQVQRLLTAHAQTQVQAQGAAAGNVRMGSLPCSGYYYWW